MLLNLGDPRGVSSLRPKLRRNLWQLLVLRLNVNRKATSRWLYWAVLMGIACQSIIALESAEGGAGRNYLAIVKRNAFQLSDTPPPKKEEAPPPPP